MRSKPERESLPQQSVPGWDRRLLAEPRGGGRSPREPAAPPPPACRPRLQRLAGQDNRRPRSHPRARLRLGIRSSAWSPQSSLTKDIRCCAFRHIRVRSSGHRYLAWFARVLELAVTAALGDKPAIVLEDSDELA